MMSEQHPGKRRGVAHAEEREGLVEQVERVEQQRLSSGPPLPPEMMKAGVKLLKASIVCRTRLKKITGASIGTVMAKNWRDLGLRVDLGGLVEVLRDAAQPGKENQHRRRRTARPAKHDQGVERVLRIAQPVWSLDAEQPPARC